MLLEPERRLESPADDLLCFIQDVGHHALPTLIDVLLDPATPQDPETSKALLETLITLCESDFIEEDAAVPVVRVRLTSLLSSMV